MSAEPDVPLVCFLEDVARILRTSRRTIDRLRRHNAFPIRELPSIDKRPRWSGESVRRYLAGAQSSRSFGSHRDVVRRRAVDA